MPHNSEAEMYVLGAMILAPEETMLPALAELRAEDLFIRSHRLIFKTLEAMHQKSEPVDVITVGNALEEQNLLGETGGRLYLSQLIHRVTTTTRVGYYTQILKKKSLLRLLMLVGAQIIELAQAETKTPEELLAAALGELEKAESMRAPLLTKPFSFESPDVRAKRTQVDGLLRERDLVLWIGPEKQGKTTLLYQLCVCLASGRDFLGHKTSTPTKVTYLDFETEPEDLQYRVAQYEQILTPEEFSLMMQNLQIFLLREELLKLDEEPSLRRGSPGHRLLKRLIAESSGSVLVLDPFQEFATDVNELDNQEVRKALKEIQRLTQDRTCIVVHHLRKADERSELKINRDFRRWTDRVRGAQAFKGKSDSVFGQALVDDESLGSILYLGAFGKRLTLDPIPIVDSERTWVWKERLSDSSLRDAESTLSEKDKTLLNAIREVLKEHGPMTRNELSTRLPKEICSRITLYRKLPKLIQSGLLLASSEGKITLRMLNWEEL